MKDKLRLFNEYYKYHKEIPRNFIPKISHIISKYLRVIHKLVIMIKKEELIIIVLNELLRMKIARIQINQKKQ